MKGMMRQELEKLLTEKEDLTKYRIFVWGTGNTTALYQEGFRRLEEEGFCICGYVDSKATEGSHAFGLRVFSPEELKNEEGALVLISTPQPKYIMQISSKLDEMGVKWRHVESYILKGHREEVLKVYDMLEDEKSKEIYAELLHCRIEGRYPDEKYMDEGQYFSFRDFVTAETHDVVVDCGAYVGDSFEQYLWKTDGQIEKYIAFEPDPGNAQAMEYRVERLKKEWNLGDNKVALRVCAVGEKSKKSYVERYGANNGLSSKVLDVVDEKEGNDLIDCISVDDYFTERFDFLKADIESYEYQMLLGAKNSIRKWRPKLAICIYHNSVDFYQIPLLIKEICSDYRIAVRHYSQRLSETVLYAYIE